MYSELLFKFAKHWEQTYRLYEGNKFKHLHIMTKPQTINLLIN